MSRIGDSYDALAATYAAQVSDELAHKPLDRALLADLARRIRGPMADLGCGPGHVTAALAASGADATGLDLSPGMVAQARLRHPGLRFGQADILALPPGRWDALVAFYSLIHFEDEALPRALASCRAALRPGGEMLAAVHLGEGALEPAEMWGIPVRLRFRLFAEGELEAALEAAGFAVAGTRIRAPYPGVEYPSRRAYVRAVLRGGFSG